MRKNQRLSGQVTSVMALAFAVFAFACTKSKELTNKVDTSIYLDRAEVVGSSPTVSADKSSVMGKLTFHLSRGIEEANSENDVGATPGMSEDFGLVRARIFEKEIQFISTFDPQGRKETMNIVASYPITATFDISREKNDYGDQTNKIIEDTSKPWSERQFIRVDWAHPSSSLSKFTAALRAERPASSGGGEDGSNRELKEENTALIETPLFEKGHISFLVETSIKTPDSVKFVWPYSIKPAQSYRVVYRTHLMLDRPSDYKPIRYTTEDFSRFGFFFTQQNFSDPRGLLDKNSYLFANAHNVCEAGGSGSCSTNRIRWVLSNDFPERFKGVARRVVKEWNETFKADLHRTDDVVYLDEANQATISDPTQNVLAYYPSRTKSGLLGVAQWVSDPRTGELNGVRATIYGDGIDSVIASVDDMISALVAGDDGLKNVIGIDQFGPKDQSTSPLRQANANVDLLSKFNFEQKFIYDNKKHSPSANPSATLQISDSLAAGQEAPEKSVIRMANFLKKAPGVFAVRDLSVLDMAIPDDQKSTGMGSVGGIEIPKLNGMESIVFASMQAKADKTQLLLDAEHGTHGVDLVEEAAVRYLVRKVQGLKSLKDLEGARQQIEEEIAQQTFYTTALHEMGHTFGLRHNFAGSADKPHYAKQYQEILKSIKDGKTDYVPADLDPYASSSIMDYGRDFFSQEAGLGSYDRAAIKYVYNHSLDRENDPIVKEKFMFCTDDQVGETINCRRFDKGANASEITQSTIDRYNQRYPFSHYRRGRLSEGLMSGWGNPIELAHSLMQNYFIPVRSVMDELAYAIYFSDKVAKPRGNWLCDKEFVAASIKAGEIADICSNAKMEKQGLDPTNISTWYAALTNPETNQPFKEPEAYIPYGFADLLFANIEAKNFFGAVLGSPEPGNYVAWKGKDAQAPTILYKLDEDLSVDAGLQDLQDRLGQAGNPQFMKQAQMNLVPLTIGDFGRQIDSHTSVQGGYTRTESIGSVWDKLAAIRVLGERDIGVQKYRVKSMSLNAYFAPQSKDWAANIFAGLIMGGERALTTIPLVLGGQPVRALVAASMNNDLQSVSTTIALNDFVSENDRSMLAKLRICDANQTECSQSYAGDVAEYHGVDGGNMFRASQLLSGDSISFNMVQEAAAADKVRMDASTDAEKASKLQADAIMALSNASPLRDRMNAAFASIPVFLKPRVDSATGKKLPTAGELLASRLNEIWSSATSTADDKPFTVSANRDFVKREMNNIVTYTSSQINVMGDDGKCWVKKNNSAPPANSPIKELTIDLNSQPVVLAAATPITDEVLPKIENANCADEAKGQTRLALLQLKADLDQASTILATTVDVNYRVRFAPAIIKNVTRDLRSKESGLENLRTLYYRATH